MILKDIDIKSREKEIRELKALLRQVFTPKEQSFIRRDLIKIENGYRYEKDNAYYLNFAFKNGTQSFLLHDIRVESSGQVAQIDHILINRFGIEILESKGFLGKLKINGDGSLDITYKDRVETLPSPIEQNKRHAQVILDLIKENIELPINLKLAGIPIINSVLIHPRTTILNEKLPEGFYRADSFSSHWDKRIDNMSVVNVFKSLGTIMSLEKAREIANLLIEKDKPKSVDYIKRYNLKDINFCSKCGSLNLEIRYGKYGYYFKCLECNGNTAIKLKCKNSSCKPRVKKEKLNFYRVCEKCNEKELFFVNPKDTISVENTNKAIA